jgi:hypothetical protein
MPDSAQYENVATGVARYLADRQRPDGGFPGPDHYGVAFALLLWSELGAPFAAAAEAAWRRLEAETPRDHGEFNAYALLHLRGREPARADPLLRRVRLDGRHSANWMLLRAVCRAMPGPWHSPARARLEARAALLRYGRGALIHDRAGVRSFTYHAFCGALLADLARLTGDRGAGAAAVRAAEFLRPFVLPNGDTLYLGRGQEQIFGYGALLSLLEAAAQLSGEAEYRACADRVFAYLLRFRREDGSFPLVLQEGEPREPWEPDASRPGWYTYNRYADYLPFLGWFLWKAGAGRTSPPFPPSASLGTGLPKRGEGALSTQPEGARSARTALLQPALQVHRTGRYTAVLAAPRGAGANGLPFPYLCVDGESVFPCYGDEGGHGAAAALPRGRFANGREYAFGERLRYRLAGTDLIGESRLVRHVRRFEFRDDGFTCRDEITFRRGARFAEFAAAHFFFRNLRPLGGGAFETQRGAVRVRIEMEPEGEVVPAACTASGELVALQWIQRDVTFRAGATLSLEVRVRLLGA